jgi:outer membrane protein TolC
MAVFPRPGSAELEGVFVVKVDGCARPGPEQAKWAGWVGVWVAGLAAAAGLAGCGRGMGEIDARTQRLVQERSARLGGGAVSPRVEYAEPGEVQRPGQSSKELGTVNPGAEELEFRPADEARDIAKKLEMYEARDGMGGPGAKGEGAEGPGGAGGVAAPVHAVAMKLTLNEALRIGQRSAREYLNAEEEYILAAIRVLIERHLWGPRLFNDTTVSMSGLGDRGRFDSALRVINDLRVSQRLPYGGVVEAGWVVQATEDLRERASGRYVQSSALVLSGNVPLLRGAGLVAQESLIQTERNLVYAARNFEAFRREFLVAIARDYFDLLEARAQISNQEQQLDLLKNILRGDTERYRAGRIAEFRVNIAANDLLRSTAGLAGQRETYILQLEQFKSRLGIDPSAAVELDPDVLTLPDPEVSLEEAVERALTYRLDLQNRRDQVDDARRGVANARNGVLPDLDLSGRVNVPTDPRRRRAGLDFSPDDLGYEAGITFGLPLDREVERLQLRTAVIGYEQRQRELSLMRDQIAIGVRQAVRNIDLARFQLQLAEKQVEINQRRVYELTLKQDQVETQAQVDAANSLQQAQSARDQARTRLRNAILTYLRDTGQLRVAADGTFEPLPGMEGAGGGAGG